MRILEVVGLTKRFAGVTALNAVSFTAEEGQILGLVGPEGAGKTTCLHCMSGVLAPDAGRIIVDGREVTGCSPRRFARAGVARTFQVARPFRRLSVAQHVAVALGRYGPEWAAARLLAWRAAPVPREAMAILERVGLGAHADRPAVELSTGMLARLEVARALARRPRLLLLDEPLAGLGGDDAAGLGDLFAGLRADGLTLVLVANGMREALPVADRVVVLDHGVLVASGTPERLRRDARVLETYGGELAR